MKSGGPMGKTNRDDSKGRGPTPTPNGSLNIQGPQYVEMSAPSARVSGNRSGAIKFPAPLSFERPVR